MKIDSKRKLIQKSIFNERVTGIPLFYLTTRKYFASLRMFADYLDSPCQTLIL